MRIILLLLLAGLCSAAVIDIGRTPTGILTADTDIDEISSTQTPIAWYTVEGPGTLTYGWSQSPDVNSRASDGTIFLNGGEHFVDLYGPQTFPVGTTWYCHVRYYTPQGVVTASVTDGVTSEVFTVPVIQPLTNTVAYVGVPWTEQIVASHGPTVRYQTNTRIPYAILGQGDANGVLSATFMDSTYLGLHTLHLYAGNYLGWGTLDQVLDIRAQPVATDAPTNVALTIGVPYSRTIAVTGAMTPVTSFTVTNLPAGLSFAGGILSGTPTTDGDWISPVAASTIGGSTTSNIAFTVRPSPPSVTSPALAYGQVGSPFAYQIAGTNTPESFGATGLPAGLTVNLTTGLISGTPTVSGAFAITLSATNRGGTGASSLALTVLPAPVSPPAITSALTASGQVGTAFSYVITATNGPATFAAASLPPGLSLLGSTIAGNPTTAGLYHASVSASNAGGTGTSSLDITIRAAPVVGGTSSSAESSGGKCGLGASVGLLGLILLTLRRLK